MISPTEIGGGSLCVFSHQYKAASAAEKLTMILTIRINKIFNADFMRLF